MTRWCPSAPDVRGVGGWGGLRAFAASTVRGSRMGPYFSPVVMAGSHHPVACRHPPIAIRVRRGVAEPGQGSHIDARGVCRYAAFFATSQDSDRPADLVARLLDGRAHRNDGGRSIGGPLRESGIVAGSDIDALDRPVADGDARSNRGA